MHSCDNGQCALSSNGMAFRMKKFISVASVVCALNNVIFCVINSFQVNINSSIRDVITMYEYQPVVSNQPEQEGKEAAADEAEVVKDVQTVVTEVRQLILDDLLFELRGLRSIKWHVANLVSYVKLVKAGDTDVET